MSQTVTKNKSSSHFTALCPMCAQSLVSRSDMAGWSSAWARGQRWWFCTSLVRWLQTSHLSWLRQFSVFVFFFLQKGVKNNTHLAEVCKVWSRMWYARKAQQIATATFIVTIVCTIEVLKYLRFIIWKCVGCFGVKNRAGKYVRCWAPGEKAWEALFPCSSWHGYI